jgi:predicted nucleotidyltransferase component of viral defense system
VGGEMLTLEQIKGYFEEQLVKKNPKGVVVEYLQHELLDSLFKIKEAASLSFIGGTAIRILQQGQRFSEGLDFDNFGLTFAQFEKMLLKTCRDLETKGFLVEHRTVERGAYHCYLRFPEILYKAGISPHAEEKILIRIDSERKDRLYEPRPYLLNKFNVYRLIRTAPLEILLSQKMMALMTRKREKGRDVFDVSLLLGIVRPDFDYLEKCLGIDKKEIIKQFTRRIEDLDLESLARDVEPFLFSAEQKTRVLTFKEYWQQVIRARSAD